MPAAIPVVAGEAVLAAEVLAAEAAAAAAAEAASVAAAEAAAQAAATAAAEQAATAAATEAATTAAATEAGTQAATQAATTGAADAATQEAVRQQLAANAGQAGLPSIAPPASGVPTGIETINPLTPSEVAQVTNNPYGITNATDLGQPPQAPSSMVDYSIPRPESLGGDTGLQQGLGKTGLKSPGLTPDQMAGPSEYSFNQGLNYESPLSASTQTTTAQPSFFDKALDYIKDNKMQTASMGLNALNLLNKQKGPPEKEKYNGPLSKFKFNPDVYQPYEPRPPASPYRPQYPSYAGGGPVEMMSNANAVGANTGYPMADISKGAYATPYQTPIARNVLTGAADTGVNPMTGEMQFAGGGIANLGGYSDGGRMLKGPGDGMSDSIPATIANKQPARLANEEFVVPADVVSHLGNGSSDAGAKALYKMMDRVRQARTGKKAQGKKINPEKYLA